jgi:hypothetical protein
MALQERSGLPEIFSAGKRAIFYLLDYRVEEADSADDAAHRDTREDSTVSLAGTDHQILS